MHAELVLITSLHLRHNAISVLISHSSLCLDLQIVFQINQDQAQPRAQMVSRDDEGKEIPVEKVEIAKKPYQFLWVSILREYLAFEFKPEGPLSFEWDQERVYDDFGEDNIPKSVMHLTLLSALFLHCLYFAALKGL